ncbi:unnamed protein product [Symbiodinium sp. KB8]|nr:unnamed protein product [Symbiodinium sp. KB8]
MPSERALPGYDEGKDGDTQEHLERIKLQLNSTFDPNQVADMVASYFHSDKVPQEVATALAAIATAFVTRLTARARQIAESHGNRVGPIASACYEAAYAEMEANGELPAPPVGAPAKASSTARIFS